MYRRSYRIGTRVVFEILHGDTAAGEPADPGDHGECADGRGRERSVWVSGRLRHETDTTRMEREDGGEDDDACTLYSHTLYIYGVYP